MCCTWNLQYYYMPRFELAQQIRVENLLKVFRGFGSSETSRSAQRLRKLAGGYHDYSRTIRAFVLLVSQAYKWTLRIDLALSHKWSLYTSGHYIDVSVSVWVFCRYIGWIFILASTSMCLWELLEQHQSYMLCHHLSAEKIKVQQMYYRCIHF